MISWFYRRVFYSYGKYRYGRKDIIQEKQAERQTKQKQGRKGTAFYSHQMFLIHFKSQGHHHQPRASEIPPE